MQLLQSILAYHVVPEVTSLANKQNLTTLLDGEWIEVRRRRVCMRRRAAQEGHGVGGTAAGLKCSRGSVGAQP